MRGMLLVIAFALATSGCADVNPSSPTNAFLDKVKLSDFALTGTTTFLSLNQKSQLTAKVKSPQGLATVTDQVTWESGDASVATVSPGGLVTSVGFGSTNVTARLNDQETTQRVDVLAPTGLTVSGTASFTALNRTNQLTLVASWPGAITRTVTSDAAWSSDNPLVATISSSGSLRSINFGSATVTAKYQSLTVSVRVDVLVTFSVLNVQGSLTLGGPGESSALTVLAVFTDNSSKDVTSETTWTSSNASVVQISAASVMTATGFGSTTITANYQGHTRSFTATVTPPGTFVATGRVRDPGNGEGQGLGLAGFLVRNTRSGLTTTSSATNGYTLVGMLPGDRVTYEKDGWETAEITFATSKDDPSPAAQPVVRINVGQRADIETAPNDLLYHPDGGASCSPCRRIRVVASTTTIVRLQLSWGGTTSRLSIWAGGKTFTAPAGPAVVTADVSLNAGENIVYVGLLNGQPFSTGYLTMTLTASLPTVDLAARAPKQR